MADWLNRCHFGDVRDVLRRMIADGVKVNTIVTSPPYWGLRDYGHPGQIGLESTPDLYVAAMVEVFALCREVLADDGTLWLNLGDSYASAPGQVSRGGPPSKTSTLAGNGHRGGGPKLAALSRVGESANKGNDAAGSLPRFAAHGIKPKDLVGIPWMTAFALRADGWYLRQEIIWAKPNPMPESVTDRCTKSHEQIFLMAKSASYYFDAEAMKEPSVTNDPRRPYTSKGAKDLDGRSEWKSGQARDKGDFSLRNKRSVWTVTTKPFKGAHFATFPPDLIEPCVLAGAPAGGIVLDPFFGSGTTGQVAQALGRQFIGIELNDEYKPLQDERLRQPSLLLEAA